MAIILHITTDAEWRTSVEKGFYEATSLKDEGFIHCCLNEQLEGVLDRYFEGMQNLVKLQIETDLLTSPFYYEWSASVGDTFPHIYGMININAVKNVERIQ
jgi:uncharacterized protein (DUF952 family)